MGGLPHSGKDQGATLKPDTLQPVIVNPLFMAMLGQGGGGPPPGFLLECFPFVTELLIVVVHHCCHRDKLLTFLNYFVTRVLTLVADCS